MAWEKVYCVEEGGWEEVAGGDGERGLEESEQQCVNVPKTNGLTAGDQGTSERVHWMRSPH